MFTPRLLEPKPLPKSLSGEQTNGALITNSKPRVFNVRSSIYSIYMKHPGADPCIMETHQVDTGDLIKCYHTLKRGMEFNLCKWLRKLGVSNVPENHWSINKVRLQSSEWLDSIPRPSKIKCHKNEKGYYIIDSYEFEQKPEEIFNDNSQGHGER
jgi:hypothetical protein